MSNDVHLEADFSLNIPHMEADFTENKQPDIQADFNIKITPSKVSQLENDLNFQTKTEVDNAIAAESEIINARIDDEVETLNTEINKKVETVTGSDLIGFSRVGAEVIISSKTFVFEQGIASDTWEIQHNLNKYPSVECVDSAGTIFTARVDYIDKNNCIVYINGSTKGTAYLN